MMALALIWLGVALGPSTNGFESASNTPMLLMLLPLLPSRAVRSAIRLCQAQMFEPEHSMAVPPPVRRFAVRAPPSGRVRALPESAVAPSR